MQNVWYSILWCQVQKLLQMIEWWQWIDFIENGDFIMNPRAVKVPWNTVSGIGRHVIECKLFEDRIDDVPSNLTALKSSLLATFPNEPIIHYSCRIEESGPHLFLYLIARPGGVNVI